MKPKSPSELTDEQLLRNIKLVKGTLISFSVIFLLMLCTCLYITATKGFGVFSVLPLTFFPLLITNIITYRKTQNEAKKRDLI